MKIGTVKSLESQSNMTARFYLDRCSNCGGKKDNPKHHQNGKCGRYKRVFVEAGTEWANANER